MVNGRIALLAVETAKALEGDPQMLNNAARVVDGPHSRPRGCAGSISRLIRRSATATATRSDTRQQWPPVKISMKKRITCFLEWFKLSERLSPNGRCGGDTRDRKSSAISAKWARRIGQGARPHADPGRMPQLPDALSLDRPESVGDSQWQPNKYRKLARRFHFTGWISEGPARR